MIERIRHFARGRRATISCVPLVAAITCAMLVTVGASAWTTNLAQLDNGTCGTNLQIGSDTKASSSATPTFWLMGDGGASSYQAFIDGVSIGTFNSDGYANVCIRTSSRLSEGAHTLTANELVPHAGYTITPFAFSVDTIAPSVPTTPVLASYSNVPGNGVSMYHNVTFVGTGTASSSITILAGAAGIGGAQTDSSGHWSASSTYLANGSYSVTAFARDQAGNQSATSGSMALRIDDTASTTTTTAAATTTTTQATTTTTVAATTTTTAPLATTTTTKAPTTTTSTAPTTTSTTVAARLPGAPTGLSAATSGKSIRLSWQAASNGGSPITSYVVYRGTSAGAETQLTSVSGTTLSFTDTNVARRVPYYYRVLARNAIGPGPLSTEVSALSH